MERTREEFIEGWIRSTERKPLVIRGARQVGKTWLVRHFAKKQGLKLLEINLEKRPHLASLFSSNDPSQIMLNLSAALSTDIDIEKSILFLDEIQVVPELFAKLRWFAEDLPQLPVIVAGSLLEFLLKNHSFSMPVGRLSYMHLEPLSFDEFLLASGKANLYKYVTHCEIQAISDPIHKMLMDLLKEYILVGGMPAAVAAWTNKRSLIELNQIHQDILATYRDDFAKYKKNTPTELLEALLLAIPQQLGHKFIYSRASTNAPSVAVKDTLDLLCKARLCHYVKASHANGIPLGAEVNVKAFKVIFLDIGLCSAALGLTLDKIVELADVTIVNHGAIAEQLIGQLLRTLVPPYVEPALFYWHREERNSSAEVDYVIEHQGDVIPVEVKAGKSGSLKSLHYFMHAKKLPLAVRFNSDLPSLTPVEVKINTGAVVSYRLMTLPPYLASQLHRLVK